MVTVTSPKNMVDFDLDRCDDTFFQLFEGNNVVTIVESKKTKCGDTKTSTSWSKSWDEDDSVVRFKPFNGNNHAVQLDIVKWMMKMKNHLYFAKNVMKKGWCTCVNFIADILLICLVKRRLIANPKCWVGLKGFACSLTIWLKAEVHTVLMCVVWSQNYLL